MFKQHSLVKLRCITIITCFDCIFCTWCMVQCYSHCGFYHCVQTPNSLNSVVLSTLLRFNSVEIIKSWPLCSNQHCTLWKICVIIGVHFALKMWCSTFTIWMTVLSLYFLVSFLHRSQLWTEELGMSTRHWILGEG